MNKSPLVTLNCMNRNYYVSLYKGSKLIFNLTPFTWRLLLK